MIRSAGGEGSLKLPENLKKKICFTYSMSFGDFNNLATMRLVVTTFLRCGVFFGQYV